MAIIWSSACQINKQSSLKKTCLLVCQEADQDNSSLQPSQTKGSKNIQGVDVLVPQRIRKAAPLSFVMGTLFCGLEKKDAQVERDPLAEGRHLYASAVLSCKVQ